MRPELFSITVNGRELYVMSYSFFLTLAAISFVLVGVMSARMLRLPAGRAAVCLGVGVVTLSIGARLMHWLTSPDSFEHGLADVLSFSRTNLSGYAGLVLAVPIMVVTAKLLQLPVWRLADATAPALAVSAALAKMGCFMNGCCNGIPTRLPWGIRLASSEKSFTQVITGEIGLFDDPLPVHPTQIYEALAALSGGVLALILMRLKVPDGVAFLAFVVWFTSWRWIVYYLLQSTSLQSKPEWFYPTLYGMVILVSLVALVIKIRNYSAIRDGFYQPAKAGFVTRR
ncbi:MAG: prolipoprotein diacylglyceryl transferase [Armatimonadota bacterium]